MCVVALLEHGADPNHSDACGRNALRVAAKSGHTRVVRLLEEYSMRSHKITHNSSSTNSITSGKYTGKIYFNYFKSFIITQYHKNIWFLLIHRADSASCNIDSYFHFFFISLATFLL